MASLWRWYKWSSLTRTVCEVIKKTKRSTERERERGGGGGEKGRENEKKRFKTKKINNVRESMYMLRCIDRLGRAYLSFFLRVAMNFLSPPRDYFYRGELRAERETHSQVHARFVLSRANNDHVFPDTRRLFGALHRQRVYLAMQSPGRCHTASKYNSAIRLRDLPPSHRKFALRIMINATRSEEKHGEKWLGNFYLLQD